MYLKFWACLRVLIGYLVKSKTHIIMKEQLEDLLEAKVHYWLQDAVLLGLDLMLQEVYVSHDTLTESMDSNHQFNV